MKRTTKIVNTTTNNRVYKMALRYTNKIFCPYCPPNKGCNRRKKSDNDYKSWKNYRDSQYRVRDLQFANCELEKNECGDNSPHS